MEVAAEGGYLWIDGIFFCIIFLMGLFLAINGFDLGFEIFSIE